MRYDRTRASWVQPAYPVTGPAYTWSTVDTIAIHYTAANTVSDDTGTYLASMNAFYWLDRGYALGYNAAVDQDGLTWEIRGDKYRSAANKDWNTRTYAILALVDGANPANPAMIDGIRSLVADCRTYQPTARLAGHRDIGATACPGDGLYAQIIAGTFEPTPDPTGDTVLYSAKRADKPSGYHIGTGASGSRWWVSDADYEANKTVGIKYQHLGTLTVERLTSALGTSGDD